MECFLLCTKRVRDADSKPVPWVCLLVKDIQPRCLADLSYEPGQQPGWHANDTKSCFCVEQHGY